MPGVSKTCAAIGPLAAFFDLPATPCAQLPALTPLSPKPQVYSSSWNGRVVAVAVVPVASKNTDKGATPLKRLATIEGEIALSAPVVTVVPQDPALTVTVVLCVAVPPAPVHITV